MESDGFSSLHSDAVSPPPGKTDTADCYNSGGYVVADELSTLESIDTVQPSDVGRTPDGTHSGPLDNASSISTIAVNSDGNNLCDTASTQESLSDHARMLSVSFGTEDEPCLSSCEPTDSDALGLKVGPTVQQNQIVQLESQEATICTSPEPTVVLGQSLKAREMSDSDLASSPVYSELVEVTSCDQSEPTCEPGQSSDALPTATTDLHAELSVAELPEPAEIVVCGHAEFYFPRTQCLEVPPVPAVIEPAADTTRTIPLTTSDETFDKFGEPILVMKPFSPASAIPSAFEHEAEVPNILRLTPSEAEFCNLNEPVATSVPLLEDASVPAPGDAVEIAPIETLQAAAANILKPVPDIYPTVEGTRSDNSEMAESAEVEQPMPPYAGNDQPEPPVSLLVQSQPASSTVSTVMLAEASALESPVPSETSIHKFPELAGDTHIRPEPTEELMLYPKAQLELAISTSVGPVVTVSADMPEQAEEANNSNPEPICSAEVPADLDLLVTRDAVETVTRTAYSVGEKLEQEKDMRELPSIVELTPEAELPALSEHSVIAVSSSHQLTAVLELSEPATEPVATKATIGQQSNRITLLPDLSKPAVGPPLAMVGTELATSGPLVFSNSHPKSPTDTKAEEKSESALLSSHHGQAEEPFRVLPKPEVRLGAQPFSSGLAGSSTSFRKVTFNPTQRLVSPPVTPTAQEHKYAFPGGAPPSALSQTSLVTSQPSSSITATSKYGAATVSCVPQDEVKSLVQHDARTTASSSVTPDSGTSTAVILSPPIDISPAAKSPEQQVSMEKAADLQGIEDERQAIKKALQVRKKVINAWQHVSENSQAEHVDGRVFTRRPSVTLLVQQSDGTVSSNTDVVAENRNAIPAKVPLVPPKSVLEARVASNGGAEAGMSGRFERPIISVSQRFHRKENI